MPSSSSSLNNACALAATGDSCSACSCDVGTGEFEADLMPTQCSIFGVATKDAMPCTVVAAVVAGETVVINKLAV